MIKKRDCLNSPLLINKKTNENRKVAFTKIGKALFRNLQFK